MTNCPDTETLAAFIDGKLRPDERKAVVSHVADCGTCYTVISDGLAVREELASRSRVRVRRYAVYAVPSALAAAAVLFLMVRVWHPEQEFRAKPASETAARQQHATPVSRPKQVIASASRSYAGGLAARLVRPPLTAPLARSGEQPPQPRTAFGFSSTVPLDKRVFRIGLCLTRLEVARRAKDGETMDVSADQLRDLLRPLETSHGPIPPAVGTRGTGASVNGADRYGDASSSVEAMFSGKTERAYLMLGAWVAAAGLAADSGDAAFFRADEIGAFRKDLEKLHEPIGTLNGLKRLETIASSGAIQPDQFKVITRLLEDIGEMY